LLNIFAKKKCFAFYLSPVCVTELKIAIATQPAKYLITLQGGCVERNSRIKKDSLDHSQNSYDLK